MRESLRHDFDALSKAACHVSLRGPGAERGCSNTPSFRRGWHRAPAGAGQIRRSALLECGIQIMSLDISRCTIFLTNWSIFISVRNTQFGNIYLKERGTQFSASGRCCAELVWQTIPDTRQQSDITVTGKYLPVTGAVLSPHLTLWPESDATPRRPSRDVPCTDRRSAAAGCCGCCPSSDGQWWGDLRSMGNRDVIENRFMASAIKFYKNVNILNFSPNRLYFYRAGVRQNPPWTALG